MTRDNAMPNGERPQPFQLAAVPLTRGITLIEASAGTGKTFSIAGLILRLVVEEHVPIERILAVTYTDAATQELRERVRKRLRDALEDLRAGASSDEIVRGFLDKTGDLPRAIRELNLALQSFDEAQIFTIHGFCKRVLQNHAFESGGRFDAELATDAAPLIEEIAHDFWRVRFYDAPPLLAALAIARKKSPDEWIALLGRMRNHPDLVVVPPADARSCEQLAAEIAACFEAVRKEWKARHADILQILREDKNLSRAKTAFCDARLAEILRHLDEACGDFDCAAPECLGALAELCTTAICKGTKGKGTPPTHAFFERCEDFCSAVNRFFRQLAHEFLAFAKAELHTRKLRRNIVTFDDLLTRVRDTLRSKSGAALAQAIGRQYRAALIDEFQDTDPLQYEIFRRLFANNEHWLFFIGDPKQAIYGFRGADVFTYFQAAQTASRAFTLMTNWRSEEPLLAGLNALFTRRADKRPFFFEAIRYHEVHAPPAEQQKNFRALAEKETTAGAPLQFRLIESSRADGKALNKEQACAAISDAVAADIARLHASGAKLGEAPLRFADMAVLVRTHAQAEQIQSTLRARGLRSVLHTDQSVFESEEALQLQRLLEGVLEPRRESALHTALATSLLGLDAEKILVVQLDEIERQRWLERFLAWRDLWENGCFIAMFRRFLVEENVRERLVSLPGGERRLTNLLHLAELLHHAEAGQRFTPDALHGWLRDQRKNNHGARESSGEAHQLRLESDGDAVLIATVHKSKGLEYPIVFCPFLWVPADSSAHNDVQFHSRDSNDSHSLVFDLRGKKEAPDEHVRWHGEEALAEELRLLYVAITRAKNRCLIYAGEIQKIEASPLGHLFEAGSGAALIAGMEELAAQSNGAISVARVDAEAESSTVPATRCGTGNDVELRARTLRGKIASTPFITSFSGLIAGTSREEPDRDEAADAESCADSAPPAGIFGFDRGQRAGVFFHDVLEHLDFQAPDQLDGLLPAKLATHGFSSTTYITALNKSFRDLLAVELAPGLSLSRISKRDRISELEFSHRLRSLTPERLHALFTGADRGTGAGALPREFCENIGRLRFSPVKGFMRGFIDLLFRAPDGRFYIVDWKSNWLGDHPADYDEAGMRGCMLEHHYFLQYHLYTLATDLFLSRRLPGYDYEKHFGGVFYIFLRGLQPANPARAIFRDRPRAALVESLRKLT